MIKIRPNLISLYGGPGSGKSAICAGVFYELKKLDYNVELVQEYAKQLVYDGHEDDLRQGKNQVTILIEQWNRQKRLIGHVDWIITDSPTLLPLIYGDKNDDDFPIVEYAVKHYIKSPLFTSYNFFIERPDNYQEYGRVQTHQQAIDIDNRILSTLDTLNIGYQKVKCNQHTVGWIVEILKQSPVYGWRVDDK